ncbi:MAG TPA: tetratricopeptide repeat protein [Blastocatellia bacterium]|jgi:Tfp pilus assembly protein PilF|nr:tetratricopeptide repeat protein [Blastocatellia bacterium]
MTGSTRDVAQADSLRAVETIPPRPDGLRLRAPVAALLLTISTLSAGAFEARAASLIQNSARDVRAASLTAEGTSALERGDNAAAKKFFERAVEINSKDVLAHTYLGVLADRAGQLREAERHFAAAVAADPSSPAAHNNYGAVLLRLGRGEQAAAQFRASLRLNKAQPSALVNLAQIRFSNGTPESLREARDLFERARALAPDAEIARALVVIALRLNDTAAASANYRDYASRLSNAPEAVTAPPARAALGAALLQAKLPGEAIEELGAAVAADPTNVDAVLLLARAHLSRKDIPSAGRALESAVARGLGAAQIYAALAEVYELSGHVENAIPAMRLAIERDPKNEDYRFRYAMILTDTKAPAAAIIRLQEAIAEFPNSSRLWFALGVAQSANYRADEAGKAFERSLELDPKFAPALAYLGMTYAEQGRFADALALYERALAIDERLAPAHFLTADAILKQMSADAARAEAHLKRAVELDPTFTPALLALGKLHLRLGRLAEAASELERVVATAPGLAEAHYQLGRTYMRLKRKPEADAEFVTFKKLSDSEKEQAQNERRDISRRLAGVRF